MAARETVIFDKYNPILEKPVTMIILAPRGSGKSVFLGEILHQNRNFFTDVWVFAGSNAVFNDYVNKVPASRLTMGYSEEKIKDIMKQSTEITGALLQIGKADTYNVAVVLDDLGFDKNIFRSKPHLELWMNSRHFRVSIFLAIQFITSVPPSIRAQADIVVSLKESIKANQKRLHEFFFGVFTNFSDFQKVLSKATEDFGALIVNNRASSSLITRCVFVYKADHATSMKLKGTREERLCNPIVWKAEKKAALLKEYKRVQAETLKSKTSAIQDSGGMVMDNLLAGNLSLDDEKKKVYIEMNVPTTRSKNIQPNHTQLDIPLKDGETKPVEEEELGSPPNSSTENEGRDFLTQDEQSEDEKSSEENSEQDGHSEYDPDDS